MTIRSNPPVGRRYEVDSKTGCWIWKNGKTSGGYGCVSFAGKNWVASRFYYEVFVGPIEGDLIVCHRCDTPSCVNPDHLFLGTHKDNQDDCTQKGRRPSFAGILSSSAKLTEDQVRSIRNDKRYQSVIAEEYGINQSGVCRIRKRQAYTNVSD